MSKHAAAVEGQAGHFRTCGDHPVMSTSFGTNVLCGQSAEHEATECDAWPQPIAHTSQGPARPQQQQQACEQAASQAFKPHTDSRDQHRTAAQEVSNHQQAALLAEDQPGFKNKLHHQSAWHRLGPDPTQSRNPHFTRYTTSRVRSDPTQSHNPHLTRYHTRLVTKYHGSQTQTHI